MRPVGLLIAAFFLALPLSIEGQNRARAEKRSPLTGTYVTKRHKSAGGTLLVRQLSPSKIEFDLECNRGAPSYNSGTARATVDVTNGVAVYRTTEFNGPCEIKFEFKGTSVVVSQTGAEFACGFGHGVDCGGIYRLKSRKPPKFEERQ